ncbi:ESX secretion-associated protein EspG [Mycobacterium sp.]|jgi:hypothetical protein|uniref:ESX secretion-associated protein EspG n=1 Tax=Mycobacterium sp. TaxID=1785 RepID=UPI002D6A315F|nr:ESX secretion-associated protein EspG [Mycobacterium sp.]HZA10654.1 ESX secretion-associated protein EspG [Mycobacterium sp.]
MALTTTPGGIWVLQALLGVETMPVALRLKPFVPSVHESMIVETADGRRLIRETAEYASLVSAGVIDADGNVDDAARDWFTVLSRPERTVVLVIRQPAANTAAQHGEKPLVSERALVVCQHRRWLAMSARCGDEVVVGPVGETDRAEERTSLICRTLLPAFGEADPVAMDGVNVQADLLLSALNNSREHGRDAMRAAVSRLGLLPDQVDVVVAAARLDESAMAVVAVVDHGVKVYVHPRVLTVADTEYGRVSITYTNGADGRQWMSIWPTSAPALTEDLTELLSVGRVAA